MYEAVVDFLCTAKPTETREDIAIYEGEWVAAVHDGDRVVVVQAHSRDAWLRLRSDPRAVASRVLERLENHGGVISPEYTVIVVSAGDARCGYTSA